MDRHDLHVSSYTYFTLRRMHDYESLCEKIMAIFQYFHPLMVTTHFERQMPEDEERDRKHTSKTDSN